MVVNTTLKDIYDFYKEFPECKGKLLVDSRKGFHPILDCQITAKDSQVIEFIFDHDNLKTSPDHFISFTKNTWVRAKLLEVGDTVQSRSGVKEILEIRQLNKREDLYDIEVDAVHEFYANDIVSHNSTLLDALCLGLFNKGFRPIPKGNFVNSINRGDTVIEVEFTSGTNHYLVRRGIKPNFFEVHCNGILLPQPANVKDQQNHFERNILKANWKSFTQVVILGSAINIPFMQLKPADRREIIEELLDLKIFSAMRTVLKDKFDDLRLEISELNYEVSTLEDKIRLEETYSKKHDDDNNVLIQSNIQEIARTEKIITESTVKINKLDVNKNKEKEKELKKKHEEIEKKIREILKFEDQIENKMSVIRDEISFFTNNETCPTCNQAIDQEFRKKAIEERSKKIISHETDVNKLKLAHEKSVATKQKISTDFESVQKLLREVTECNTKIATCESFIEKMRKEIQALKHNDAIIKKASTDDLRKELELKKKKSEELNELKDIYTAATNLLKDSGIKAQIIKQYSKIINERINFYIQKLNFFAKFTLDENFEETIKSRHSDDFKYENLSEGEKKKLNIAIIFAWRDVAILKNSLKTNLLLFDELLDSSLDPLSVEGIIKVIKGLKNHNIIIITHNPDLKDQFDSGYNQAIYFEKIKNFSRIKII